MIDYNAINYAIFNSSGNFLGVQNGLGSFEAESGTTWTVGTTVTGTSGTFEGTSFEYIGTSVVEGKIYPVVVDAGTTFLLADETLPRNGFQSGLPDVQEQSFVACFMRDTAIAVPGGSVLIQNLSVGDLVSTFQGDAVPIKWIGYQTLHKLFTPTERFAPVRIKAGALAENMPHTDLVVTPDHGIMVGEIMANAGALVNGSTIVRVPMAELDNNVMYYHIETEDHDVILACGAPAETYIDNVARSAFDNYSEYVALYGEPGRASSAKQELAHPRAMSRRQLPQHIAKRIVARASVLADEIADVA